MPLTVPALDDRRYFADLLARIPVYAPDWTDRSDSDPGVTVLELLAYLEDSLFARRRPARLTVALTVLAGTSLAARALARRRACPAGLVITVDGVLWARVDSFEGVGPSDQVYVVEETDAGTCVRFGDGVRGARPAVPFS
jgi:hypothetical protein